MTTRQDMAQEMEGSRHNVSTPSSLWKPKLCSNYTVIFTCIACIFLAAFIFTMAFSDSAVVEALYVYVINPYLFANNYLLLVISIVLFALAGSIEAVSRLRVPPPNWRVKQELIRALIDMGVLSRDRQLWQGMFWIAPVGKYNSKSKCYEIPFDVRSVKLTEEKVKNLEEGIAGFAHSQSATIEHVYLKHLSNRRECMKLCLWYTQDPFQSVEQMKPW